jgi:hypothetical protein
MLFKGKVVVYSEIHTEHIKAMWAPCRILGCQTWWYIKSLVVFKRYYRFLYKVQQSCHESWNCIAECHHVCFSSTCLLWKWRINNPLKPQALFPFSITSQKSALQCCSLILVFHGNLSSVQSSISTYNVILRLWTHIHTPFCFLWCSY